jgi:putative addiction module component (TIGR02574 family)
MLDVQRNPALKQRVQARLEEYRADPNSGLSWDELKGRILSRQKIA